jgi:N utilization substance protein B
MSDIKSYQRLLAVQAIYENSINQKEIDVPIYEMLSHIIANADFKNKIHGAKLSLTKEIYNGVFTNLKTIDSILKKSLKKNNKVQSFDKLLLSIFRCAIYEIVLKNEISKKIVISEYLLISNHFFGIKEATLLNGVLDNLREI